MQIPEHGYIVEQIDALETTEKGNHKFQRIILKKPGWKDEFGEQKGNDDLFEVRVWNQKINELPQLQRGDKIKATLYFQGNESVNDRGQKSYFVNVGIGKITVL